MYIEGESTELDFSSDRVNEYLTSKKSEVMGKINRKNTLSREGINKTNIKSNFFPILYPKNVEV